MPRRIFGASLLLASFVLLVSGSSLTAQNKKKDAPQKQSDVIDSAKLNGREYVGKLVRLPGTDRHFIVEITSVNVVPTGVNRGNRLRPPTLRTKAQEVRNNVEFQLSETAKIRTMLVPEVFDDKGNVKKYSKSELAKLRGKDARLPGFEAEVDKLEIGQTVRLHLSPVAVKTPAKNSDEGDLGKPDKRLQVRMMVILQEGTGENWGSRN